MTLSKNVTVGDLLNFARQNKLLAEEKHYSYSMEIIRDVFVNTSQKLPVWRPTNEASLLWIDDTMIHYFGALKPDTFWKDVEGYLTHTINSAPNQPPEDML